MRVPSRFTIRSCRSLWLMPQLFIATSALSATVAESLCRSYLNVDESIPECPSQHTRVLSEGYPALAVAISENIYGPAWVVEIAQTIFKAQPDRPPQLLLAVSDQTYAMLLSAIDAQGEWSAGQKTRFKASLTRIAGQTPWQQDLFQSVVENGVPRIRSFESYKDTRRDETEGKPVPQDAEAAEANQQSIISALNEQCGIREGNPYGVGLDGARDDSAISSHMGGNIEGGPYGSCFVGDKELTDEQWDALATDLCGAKALKIKVPVSSFAVGHVDEMAMTIRTGPGRCDEAVLIASPQAAIDQLKENRDQPVDARLAEYLKITNKEFVRLLDDYYSEVCDGLDDNATADYNQAHPDAPTKFGLPEYKAKIFDFKNTAWRRQEYNAPELLELRMDNRCFDTMAQATGGDILRYIDQESAFKYANLLLERQGQEFAKDLAAQFGDHACGPPRIGRLPILVKGQARPSSRAPAELSSILPNPVNMQQFGNTLIIPDPGPMFRGKVQAQIEGLSKNLKIVFKDTTLMNARSGNIHCSLNAVRYCRPIMRSSDPHSSRERR